MNNVDKLLSNKEQKFQNTLQQLVCNTVYDSLVDNKLNFDKFIENLTVSATDNMIFKPISKMLISNFSGMTPLQTAKMDLLLNVVTETGSRMAFQRLYDKRTVENWNKIIIKSLASSAKEEILDSFTPNMPKFQ